MEFDEKHGTWHLHPTKTMQTDIGKEHVKYDIWEHPQAWAVARVSAYDSQ